MAERILVPVDGSSRAKEAFEHALEEHPESTVVVLHVLNPVNMISYSDEEGGFFDVEGYRREEESRRASAEEMMERYRAEAADRSVAVQTIVTVGSPARRILETVENESVDHVVMGSRGRSGVGRVLFGSVAETVTRRSPVPVTIVR